MVYNTNNITGFADLAGKLSDHSEGFGGAIFLVIILFTLYIYGRSSGASAALSSSAFVVSILAIIARMLGLVNTSTMMGFIIVLTIAFLIQQLGT